MEKLQSNFKIIINNKLYIKDPETSSLGKKIIEQSILLIDAIGFELFTFKKLGDCIKSNESSIYRYFENKHKLLIYLSSWYWSCIEYNLVFATQNIENPIQKLETAITIVTQQMVNNNNYPDHINQEILNRIIIYEFNKTFLTKEVDQENKEGFFLVYKRIINQLVEIITTINPNYLYPKTLASTIIEGALHQQFTKNHFKTITDFTDQDTLTPFYIELAKKTIL